ncbi:hypothetical protein ACQPYA_03865 [Micromonospora sp. CA-263727]|uniref:hypothetical protein n=1 Tax=Micromonospora sp. CA-263727 TaxID=3239967 RepID=UPI003D923085
MPTCLDPPAIDTAREAAQAAARLAERAAIAHANERCRLACLLLRGLPALATAVTVVFDHDEKVVTAETVITLVHVRDADGTLLWYDDCGPFAAHPDAVALGDPPTFNAKTIDEVHLHLIAAYDADPGHFNTSDDGAAVMPHANLLEMHLPSALGQSFPPRTGREVVIEASGRQPDRLVLVGDDTLTVLVDGRPSVGVDIGGPGHWPDGETWERLPIGGVTTERDVMVLGMSEDQFRGLAPLLGLPASWFGRWKGAPGELRDIRLDNGQWSCVTDAGLDAVIRHVRDLGLTFEETRATRYAANVVAPADTRHGELDR